MTEKDKESLSKSRASGDTSANEVIELTDVVDHGEEVIELTDVASHGNGEEIIELTDVVQDAGAEDDVIALTDVVPDSAGAENAGGVPVTPAQIDAALERTVEKLYGRKIEKLLVDIVQKKVAVEIEKVKKMILDSSATD